jgi:hypothetical protein
MRERLQSAMIVHGALVFIVGLLAGFPFAFVILGKIALWPVPGAADVHMPGDVRGWHMAHLEGILNGLTLFAVAAIMPQLRLGETGLKVVAWTLIVTAWGNIIASVIGPVFGGRGLEFGGSVANSLMYVLFVIAIVTVLIALALVARGARRRS